MDNNIQFIDQRLAHLRFFIPRCNAQSAAAEKRFADLIITIKIKHIQASTLSKRDGELRALIPVYKAHNPTYEHVFVKQIIDIDLQLIEAKFKNFSTHSPVSHPSAAHSPLPQPFSAQPLEINMVGILTVRPRQIPNLY